MFFLPITVTGTWYLKLLQGAERKTCNKGISLGLKEVLYLSGRHKVALSTF